MNEKLCVVDIEVDKLCVVSKLFNNMSEFFSFYGQTLITYDARI